MRRIGTIIIACAILITLGAGVQYATRGEVDALEKRVTALEASIVNGPGKVGRKLTLPTATTAKQWLGQWDRLRRGMTHAQVTALIGTPTSKKVYSATKGHAAGERWTYRGRDRDGWLSFEADRLVNMGKPLGVAIRTE